MFDVNDNFEMKETKMKAISLRKIVIAVVIIGIATGYVRADKLQLQARLSKEAGFEFKDVTIAQALKKIEETAEVKIVLSDEAVWKLPYGEATRLSASLGGPLADSLTEMLNAFFMRYAVGDEEITIYPRQELEHILGRPSTKQLNLLKAIYANPIEVYTSGHVPEEINRVLGQEVIISPIQMYSRLHSYLAELSDEEKRQKGQGFELSIPVTLANLLDQELETWYVAGADFPNQIQEIRVVSDEDFRVAVLDQVVDISFKDESADVIIRRLVGWTGMELLVDKKYPSWLEEEIIVDMQNIKLRQALRNIVSTVDGDMYFDFGVNGIQIKGPERPRKKESASEKSKSVGSAGEGYVGKISIPMGEGESKYYIEFMLRESDLTEELKKLREEKIREILRKVGKAGDKALEIAAHPQSYSILN
jgi:hypothetical protein